MYSEKTYKNYIFWMQVKRIVVIIIMSCLGATIGILIGKILESTIKLTTFNNTIIIVSTIVFFLLSLLLTVGTGKEVQDGYWKIAVLRKLTVIQKNIEFNNELLKNTDKSVKEKMSSIVDKVNFNENNDEGYGSEEMALVPKKQSLKSIKKKTIKKPEEIN